MSEVEKEVRVRVHKYKVLTKKALKKAKICVPKGSALYKIALDFREMAENYVKDAEHFEQKGEIVLALASLSYAHAWLDAGARLGLFDVKQDSKLFTLYS
ncbi:MAG: DUF357 domain-containing protein [Candidatus Diapherotrites archaeon]